MEVLAHLANGELNVVIDGTFGRGGHSRAILEKMPLSGQLFVFDKDPTAIAAAKQWQQQIASNIIVTQGSFTSIKQIADEQGVTGAVDAVLLDVGVSSPQLDDPLRGFSFSKPGPLDLRMNPSWGETAAEWLQRVDEKTIVRVLFEYGEERFARRIAGAIKNFQAKEALTTTTQLADIIARAVPTRERHKHPATRTFQALRVVINDELTELANVLPQAMQVLKRGGRLLVISFHSLEHRIIKEFIRKEQQGDFPLGVPVTQEQLKPRLRLVGKPISQKAAEIAANPRSRSAILRIVEKLR